MFGQWFTKREFSEDSPFSPDQYRKEKEIIKYVENSDKDWDFSYFHFYGLDSYCHWFKMGSPEVEEKVVDMD